MLRWVDLRRHAFELGRAEVATLTVRAVISPLDKLGIITSDQVQPAG